MSTLGVGGAARWFLRATSADVVASANAWAAEHGVPLFILGGGSNLVVADDGLDGLVMQIAMTGIESSSAGGEQLVTAAAGESWDDLVAYVVQRGLAGVECLSGIPGTVGGTPIQNVGAYGQEVSHVIDHVTVFDRQELATIRLVAADCAFNYRMSRFKRDDAARFIVCAVTFRLHAGPPTLAYPDVIEQLARDGVTAPTVRDARNVVLKIRRRKGMVLDTGDPDTHSVGSFFMNPVVPAAMADRIVSRHGDGMPCYAMSNGGVKIPAAWLIERSGFTRGHADGAVGLSTKHTLAIVNRGQATARDVVRFAGHIKRAVLDRFGISLCPEPVFVGFSDEPDVAFLMNHKEHQHK